MSDSLWPHGLQHARFPCPSLTLRVCSNSCPLCWYMSSVLLDIDLGMELLGQVQFSCSVMFDFCDPMDCSMPGFPVHHQLQSLRKFVSIKLVMPCHPTISSSVVLLLSSIFPSIRDFSNESALRIKWPKYWSSRFSISPSSEYSGLISFRIDWFDLLAVQGILKSFL